MFSIIIEPKYLTLSCANTSFSSLSFFGQLSLAGKSAHLPQKNCNSGGQQVLISPHQNTQLVLTLREFLNLEPTFLLWKPQLCGIALSKCVFCLDKQGDYCNFWKTMHGHLEDCKWSTSHLWISSCNSHSIPLHIQKNPKWLWRSQSHFN